MWLFRQSRFSATPPTLWRRRRATYWYYYCCCLSTLATASQGLRVAVLTGTSRTAGPPNPILGPRVQQFVVQHLTQFQPTNEDDTVAAPGMIESIDVLDPRTSLPLPLLEKPAFAYARSQIPEPLRDAQTILQQADAYVLITPEYNHAPSPALINLLNHFGSSVFSFKPSAIVSYSAGQWGGTRAALALRPILSELGCLPVSAMVHIPHAGRVLDEAGQIVPPEEASQWNDYLSRCSSQLVWWGQACQNHRQIVDPFEASPAFRSAPSQRNAP